MAPTSTNTRQSHPQQPGRGRPRKGANVNKPTESKGKGKIKANPIETDDTFPVRSILNETKSHYLLDWEGEDSDGEPWKPSWEPKHNATRALVDEWEAKQRGKERKKGKNSSTVIEDSQSGPSTLETSQDSQPIHTGKRKRQPRDTLSPGAATSERFGSGTEARNKRQKLRQRLRAGVGSSSQKSEPEETHPAIAKDEIEDSLQEDTILSSGSLLMVIVDQNKDKVDREDYPLVPEAFSSTNNPASGSNEIEITAQKSSIADSYEAVSTSEKTQTDRPTKFAEEENHSVIGHPGSSGPIDKPEALDVLEGEASDFLEEPPSYRERAKYLDEEEVDDPVVGSSQQVSETPVRPATEGPKENEPTEKLRDSVDERGTSNRSQVCIPDARNVLESSQQLTALSPVASPVNSQQVTDDPELPIPLQPKENVETELVPPLVHTSDSEDQDSEKVESPQFQSQIPFSFNRNNTTQSSQEKPSSLLSAVSVARSSPNEYGSAGYSEIWQGAQVVTDSDPISSQSSSRTNAVVQGENGPNLLEEEFPEPNHARSEHILASIEDDNVIQRSPLLPPQHSIPYPGAPPFLEAYGSNSPARPSTASNFNMEENLPSRENDNSTRLPSIAERLKEIRRQSAQFRSPSVIPERIPTPPVAHPGQMLPSHQHHIDIEEPFLPGVLPSQDVSQGEGSLEELTEVQAATRVPLLGTMEYLVPLPMTSPVRDVYAAAVKIRKDLIKLFTSETDIDPATIEAIDDMIEDLKKCCVHQDLISEPSATQANTPHHVTAQWATTSSTKCMFLRKLLDEARDLEIHIIVLGRPGKTLDIIESICIVDNIHYDRPGSHTAPPSSAVSPLKVTLLPTGEDLGVYVVSRANIVIGFDDTFSPSDPYIRGLRADLYEDKLAPLISPIVINSVEHLDRCIPRDMDPLDRKSILIRCIVHTVREHEFGVVHPEDSTPDQCATRIARFLSDGTTNWPMSPIPEATVVEMYLTESTQQTMHEPLQEEQIQEESGSTTQSYDAGAEVELQVPQSSLKRSWKNEGEERENSKRLRATPQPEGVDFSADAHISDSNVNTSLVFSTPAENAAANQTRSHSDTLNDSNDSWQARITQLEAELRAKTTAELQLRAENAGLRKDIAGHEKGVRIMQPRFQEALNERAAAVHEAKVAAEKLANATSRLETRNAEVAKLKQDKTRLENDLIEVRQSLKNSVVPEISEMAKAQELARQYFEEKERAERKLESMKRDFEFTRDSYQKASSTVGELSTQIEELRQRNIILARKADENRVTIAQINNDQAVEFHVQRIKELQIIKADREEELARRDEELRLLKEGRRGTRGTSMPRSPMVNAGVLSPKPAGSRSRAGSPSVGDIVTSGPVKDLAHASSGGAGTSRFAHLSRFRE